MAEGRNDWAVGDLALCVNTAGWAIPGIWQDEPGPDAGQVLAVAGVRTFAERIGLQFGEWAFDWFHAVDFRKITPGADIVGVEAEKRISVPHICPPNMAGSNL